VTSAAAKKLPLVLITGCSGLIGGRVARALAGRYRIVGLDRDPPDEELPGTSRFWRCDLTDDAQVAQVLRDVRAAEGAALSSVIHLAAYYDFSGEPSDLYEKLTVQGTRRLLRELRAFGAVEQFVFASSLLVMRPSTDGTPIDEQSPVEAAWDYPQSKVRAEAAIDDCRGPIPAVVLRIAGVYDDDCHSIPIAQQIKRIHEKRLESYFFPGDASHGQAFVHADDVADCFLKTVEARHELPGHAVFLVAEPDVMSYSELQDRIGLVLHGEEWPTIRVPVPLAKAGAWLKDKLPAAEEPFIKPWMIDLADAHYPVAIDKARRELGWEPRHRLRWTLDSMLARLREDPVRFYHENHLPLPPDLAPQEDGS